MLKFICGLFIGTLIATASATSVAQQQVYKFDIPTQTLDSALRTFARTSRQQILFDGKVVRDKRNSALVGDYSVTEGLNILLQGTGLNATRGTRGAFVVTVEDAVSSTGSASQGELALRIAQMQADSIQEAEESASDQVGRAQADAEIVVTGSHIRGVNSIGTNVVVFDREDIEASGRGRVQDFLEQMPLNFSGSANEDGSRDSGASNLTRGAAIDLRGLGASATLILVNGRRQPSGGLQGSFVDISSIAASAVERIEILTDGASALYGSDAVGGVVNFVLRKDYQGFETDVRWATTDGTADELRASQVWGGNWSGGNLLLGYQYNRREALAAADAFYASRSTDYREFGGDDFRNTFANPGTILNPATLQPAFAIPKGQNGTGLTAAALIPGRNVNDALTGYVALPEQTQHSAFFALSQNLGDGIDVFAEGRYGRREMTLPFGGATSALSVPAGNPFYVNAFGTAGPLRITYDFLRDLGPSTQASTTETYSLTAGAIADLGPAWKVNVAASHGRETNAWEWFNQIDSARLTAALADPNPTTAFNPFGDGSYTNPATLASIRGSQLGKGEFASSSLTAVADGPLFRLPAGEAKLAVGLDYRDERLEASRGNLTLATGVFTRSVSGSVGKLDRQVAAMFGEVVLPVLNDSAGAHALELALAGRYEDYSDFGSTVNPKIGLNFTPAAGMKFRGSWGTSFRAPRFNELSQTTNIPSSRARIGVPDPKSSTGVSNVLELAGGNPNLSEEKAETWTAGVDLALAPLPGFSLSATYFEIDYEDKIQTGGQSTNTLLFENVWTEIITRNPTPAQISGICNRSDFNTTAGCPSNAAAIVDLRIRNLAGLHVRGIDLNLGYTMDAGPGKLSFGFAGTRLLTHEFATSSTAPFSNVLDTAGYPVSLRMRGSVGWSPGRWQLNAFVNHIGDYRDANLTAPRKVGSWTTIDSGIAYRFDGDGWLNGTRMRLSVLNLFDKEPPFVNQFQGFDFANANDMGRSMSVDVSKSW